MGQPRASRLRHLAWGLVILAAGAGSFVIVQRYVVSLWWLSHARRALAQRTWSQADRYLARHMASRGVTDEGRLLAAQIDANAGRLEDAARSLRDVSDEYPDAAQARYFLARLLLQLNRASEAERVAKESLQLDPEGTGPRRLLFEIYRWEGRDFEARKLVEEIYDRAPEDVKGSLLSYLFTVDYGRYGVKEAGEQLKQFLAADPDNVNALAALAALEAEGGRLERARNQLERCLRIDPEHLFSRVALSQCCSQLGDFERVKELLDTWPEHQRDIRYTRARAIYLQSALADCATAAAEFQRVLEQFPDDWQTRHRLGTCLVATGQTEQGEKELVRAAKVRQLLDRKRLARLLNEVLPDLSSADHCFQIASFYEELGYKHRATQWYELVLKIDPKHQAALEASERLHDTEFPSL